MAGAIVQIQTALGTGTGSSIAKAITVSAGNHIVAYVGSVFGTTATASFSDSGSGTWNTTTTLTPSFGIRKCAYSENRSGTITVTATFGSADHRDRSLVLIEVSGLQASGSLDQAIGQDQGAATGTDSVTSTNPSATTNANDFVLGITANSNLGANASAGTGFTAASGSPFAMDGNDVSVESKSVSSTGVYPALFTPNTGGSSWDTFVLIFKEATAAAAQVPVTQDIIMSAWAEEPWPQQRRARAALLPSAPIDSPVPGWARILASLALRQWDPGDPWPQQRRPVVTVDTPAVAVQPPFVRRLVPGQDDQPWPQQRRLGQPPVAPPPLLTREWAYQVIAAWAEPELPRQPRRFVVVVPPVVPDNPPIGWPRRGTVLRVREAWEPPPPMPQQLRRSGIDKPPPVVPPRTPGILLLVVDDVVLEVTVDDVVLSIAVDDVDLTVVGDQ